MNDALYKDINQNLVVLSAWRSTATQRSFAKARGEFAAPAGRSEHQLGVAMDINMAGSPAEERFGDTVAYTSKLMPLSMGLYRVLLLKITR